MEEELQEIESSRNCCNMVQSNNANCSLKKRNKRNEITQGYMQQIKETEVLYTCVDVHNTGDMVCVLCGCNCQVRV